jgi:hypothetical protein
MRATEADVHILIINLQEQAGWSTMNKAHVSPVPEYNEQKRFAEISKRRQIIQSETCGIEEELKAFHAALLTKAFRGDL